MQSDWYNLKLRNVISFNIKILKICGYWWPDDEKIQKHYNYYAAVVLSTTYFLYALTEGLSNLFTLHDMEKVTDSCFLFLTHVAQLGKCYTFTIHHERVKRWVDDMGIDIFRPRYPEQIQAMRASTRNMKIIYHIFLTCGIITCALWTLFPFLDRENLSLPLASWYPFSTEGYPIFPIIYILQMFWCTLNAVANITLDSTIASFLASICDQLVLLNDYFENIKVYCELEEQACEPVWGKGYEERLQARMDKELRRCVIHHKTILKMVEGIDSLFSYVLLGQFAITVIIVCITMFKLSVVPLRSIQFESMVLYQVCMLTEVLLCCWYGNEIILKSSQLSVSVFNSDWTNCTLRYKQNLLVVMVRTKVPITMYAGHFCALSLETFTNILRKSWSYFAVLHHIHDKV